MFFFFSFFMFSLSLTGIIKMSFFENSWIFKYGKKFEEKLLKNLKKGKEDLVNSYKNKIILLTSENNFTSYFLALYHLTFSSCEYDFLSKLYHSNLFY